PSLDVSIHLGNHVGGRALSRHSKANLTPGAHPGAGANREFHRERAELLMLAHHHAARRRPPLPSSGPTGPAMLRGGRLLITMSPVAALRYPPRALRALRCSAEDGSSSQHPTTAPPTVGRSAGSEIRFARERHT